MAITKLKGKIIGYKKEGDELTIKLDKEPKQIPLGVEMEIVFGLNPKSV